MISTEDGCKTLRRETLSIEKRTFVLLEWSCDRFPMEVNHVFYKQIQPTVIVFSICK